MSAAKSKILVLGADSYLGKHLVPWLGVGRSVGTYFFTAIEGARLFDAMTMNLDEVVEEQDSISHAVILYGDTKPDSCAEEIEKSHALNVESIKAVIDWLLNHGIKPVFTSTESVFDGSKGNYVESDKASPVHPYGRQKVEIEQYLQTRCNDYIIVRLGRILGSQRGDGTLLDGWLDEIEQGRTIYCAHDQIFSPVYVDDVVEGITRLIDLDCAGLFHLSNPKPYSRLEILQALMVQAKKYIGTDDAKVVPCRINDLGLPSIRPLDISMVSDKLVKSTCINLTEIPEVCEKMAKGAYGESKTD